MEGYGELWDKITPFAQEGIEVASNAVSELSPYTPS
jgi:hypothetical protein